MLLHVCCGPCLIGSISRILSMDDNEKKQVGIDINIDNISEELKLFFYNSNVDTYEEYLNRLFEVEKVAEYYDLELIYDDEEDFYLKQKEWNKFISLRENYESEKEGGSRCMLCIDFRLKETSILAKEMNEKFSTTLTISPYKNTKKIFDLAKEKYDDFLFIDFKKREGYKASIKLSKEFDMYRQNYCGCIYSKKNALNDGVNYDSISCSDDISDKENSDDN